jgi:hypothetical protein
MAVRLQAPRTGRTLLPRNIIYMLLVLRLSKPQGLVLPEVLGKLKKSKDLIGSRIHDLPASSIAP